MNSVKYDSRSPYKNTNQTTNYVDYLDFWSAVAIPPNSSDLMIQLDTKYANRPDLLSYDLYGTPQLWWVFAMRNPNTIKDPIYDFRTGIIIYAPTSETIVGYV